MPQEDFMLMVYTLPAPRDVFTVSYCHECFEG